MDKLTDTEIRGLIANALVLTARGMVTEYDEDALLELVAVATARGIL